MRFISRVLLPETVCPLTGVRRPRGTLVTRSKNGGGLQGTPEAVRGAVADGPARWRDVIPEEEAPRVHRVHPVRRGGNHARRVPPVRGRPAEGSATSRAA